MARRDLPETLQLPSRIARRYLIRGEHVEISTRLHRVRLAEPIASAVGALLLTMLMAATREAGQWNATLVFLALFALLALRAVWRYLNWRVEWFVATDRRLLRTYGLLNQRVAMMPLAKVTDMSYDRSVPGRLLGYGDFVLESAGQDQTLREINYIPRPDRTYNKVMEMIFGPEVADPGEDGERWERDRPNEAGRDWEATEPHERPPGWTWVEDEARGARAATRHRTVAVDPDPTPYQ